MSPKTVNHLRVVININEQYPKEEYEDIQNTNVKNGGKSGIKRNINGHILSPSPAIRALPNSECDNMKAEVFIVDDKSLLLNLISTEKDEGPYTDISHKMHFDYVSQSAGETIKNELATVMDDLLLKHKNCGIMRFVTEDDMDIAIFFDYFITFLNKRIYHQQYKLQYVKLECLVIAASEEILNSPRTEKEIAFTANQAGLRCDISNDCNSSNGATFKLTRNAKNQFRTTRDLLLWLLSEYRHKFSNNKGHEKLQFTFSIVDRHQNIFKVKLSLFNIYLNMMSTDDRNHWLHYMDHMGGGCQGLDCNFVHSGLTISLSGHIEGIVSKNTLLLFDVPTHMKMTADTIEMLQMAHSVIKNRKRKHLMQIKNINPNRRLSLNPNEYTNYLFAQREEELKNNLATNHIKERRSSLALPIKREAKEVKHPTLNKPLLLNISLFSNDFSTLSGWYRKIDEHFRKICQMREKYFNRYFEFKIKQISSNIRYMFKSLESLCFQPIEQDVIEVHDETELHELFERYCNLCTLFRQLQVKIKDSEFEEILTIYLETKTFDLNEHALALKQKHLNLCQQYLKLTFSNLSSDSI